MASKKQPKPETTEDAPPERGYRKSVNIGFDASDLENLETVLADMRRDPGVRALKAGLGIAKQARYAIAKYAEILRRESHDGLKTVRAPRKGRRRAGR